MPPSNSSPSATTTERPTWYRRIFDAVRSAYFPADSSPEFATEPVWVKKVLKKLAQQAMPAFSLKPQKLTPLRVGRLLGQQQANRAAIDKALEMSQAPERLAQDKAMLEQLAKNTNDPASVSLLAALEFRANALAAVEPLRERLNEITLDALKTAWEQPSQLERLAFFQGLVEGLSKPGLPLRVTDATPIYERLWVHRKIIKELKSVPELYSFLLSTGLSDSILGRPDRLGRCKRLEKVCQRLELSPGKPGRPTTAE